MKPQITAVRTKRSTGQNFDTVAEKLYNSVRQYVQRKRYKVNIELIGNTTKKAVDPVATCELSFQPNRIPPSYESLITLTKDKNPAFLNCHSMIISWEEKSVGRTPTLTRKVVLENPDKLRDISKFKGDVESNVYCAIKMKMPADLFDEFEAGIIVI